MDAIENILSRHSVREYLDKKVSNEDIKTILTAGMSGPSAVNCKPWEFLITQDKDVLEKMAKANGPYAKPILNAAFGILVLGNTAQGYGGETGYWPVDCSIACQNMILAAHALGIGSVWLGTYPEMDRVQHHIKDFNLPGNIVPLALLSFGYPKKENHEIRDQYDESKVHYDKW